VSLQELPDPFGDLAHHIRVTPPFDGFGVRQQAVNSDGHAAWMGPLANWSHR